MIHKRKLNVVKNLETDNRKNKYYSKNIFSKILISTVFMAGTTFNTSDYMNNFGTDKEFNINYENKMAETENKYNNIISINNINKLSIPVLMIHKIGTPEDRYTLSPNNFRKILNNIYESKHHLIGLKEFKEGNFSNIPVGKKPLLLTFDDAGEGQFYFSEMNKPTLNSAVGILEKFKAEKKDFSSKATFFISYSDDKHNFREPFIERGLSEKKIKYLFENGYDLGWHTPFHTNNTNASKINIDEQTIILDALIFKSLGEKNYNSMIRSFAHPFGAKPKNIDVLDYLFSKYDLVFDAWGENSSHPLSEKFDKNSIPRIETHMNNIESILGNKNNYEVTKEDSIFYDRKFNENINIEPKGIEPLTEKGNWDYFLNSKTEKGEL